MGETWRVPPGWECEASYGGDIRTTVRGLPYVLRPSLDRKGYPQVTVAGRTVRKHRLVALAWLPAPKRGKPQVRHLDGDKENCAAWNLKWGDDQDQRNDDRQAGKSSRVKRGVMRVNGSERRGKEGNRTGAYRAHFPRTSRT
jgi:hypothetical protein